MQSSAFQSEGIDQILSGRTEKRQLGGRAGNSFSVATFGGGTEAAPGEDYWLNLMPEAAAEHERSKKLAAMPVILAPRKRKAVDYSERVSWPWCCRVCVFLHAAFACLGEGKKGPGGFMVKGGRTGGGGGSW